MKYPQGLNDSLIAEWNYGRNQDISGSINSHSKVWWSCSLGHEFECVIRSRVAGVGCSICDNRIVLAGFNDFATRAPELVDEWDFGKNTSLPTDYVYGSNASVWWLCSSGHGWEALISNRMIYKAPCPYCSGQKLALGINDIATVYPNLAAQWNYARNEGLDIKDFAASTHKAVWWICELGHEWASSVNSRKGGRRGCPYCKNKRLLVGFNDLATTNPHLVSEWDDKTRMQDYVFGSSEKVGWKCKEGHSWRATIISRSNVGNGCPYCSNHLLAPGFNDLATKCPDLASQWSKRNEKAANEVACYSSKKFWWQCPENPKHEYFTTPRTRMAGSGCPQCVNNVSKAEKEMSEYLEGFYPDLITGARKVLPGRQELDIYIPSQNLAIEYNGLYWHSEPGGKDSEYHLRKWSECKRLGIDLVFVWEDDWAKHGLDIAHRINNAIGSDGYAGDSDLYLVENGSIDELALSRDNSYSPIEEIAPESYYHDNATRSRVKESDAHKGIIWNAGSTKFVKLPSSPSPLPAIL